MHFSRKNVLVVFLLLLSSVNLASTTSSNQAYALGPAPQTVEQCQEIAIQYNEQLPELYNNLSPEERVFLYYLYRASLPGDRIIADQIHSDANTIIDIFSTIIQNKNKLLELQHPNIDMQEFIKQAECYFIYVWTNHGQYFEKEFENNKRTPGRLGLALLTPQNLVTVLLALNYPDAEKTVAAIQKSLFDQTYKPTSTVPGSIDKSAVNIYSDGFTDADYQTLSAADQNKLNNYFYLTLENGKRIPKAQAYSATGRCGKELAIVCYWLEKAYNHAQKYPAYFDEHLTKSLKSLISFFQTGDEELFKQHSIEWLKTTSRISYCLGFIESYKDPKDIRGFFQGEATIRSVDLTKLNATLPTIEQQLPVPQEFKRTDMTKLPNACIACKVFGTGDLGPLRIVSAYCLPNYGEIRATVGSKQIVYSTFKQLPATINPEGNRKLFFPRDREQWLTKNDPNCSLLDDLWDLHVILHETIGHGSGRYTNHTFMPGDPMTIEGKTYAVGDCLPVTDNNKMEFVAGYGSALEELRAEIIAFYVMITNLDKLTELGFLKKWTDKLTKEELIDWIIYAMIHNSYFRRLVTQADGAQEISGDHARADWTICSYLLDKGCFSVVEQPTIFKGTTKTVLTITNTNVAKTVQAATMLVQEVQRIKSTADGIAAKKLIDGYCKPMRNPHYITIMKDNFKAVVGNLKVSAVLSPIYTPIQDKQSGEIIDIQATWPTDILELAHYQQENELITTM